MSLDRLGKTLEEGRITQHSNKQLAGESSEEVARKGLGEDICKVIEPETDPHNAVREMHRRLYRWQEFLMRHSPDGLSSEQRTGLFGELELLRSLILKNLELTVRNF